MIPLYKVYMPENIDKEIAEILYSGRLAYGNNSRQFEDSLRKFIGNEFILSVCNTNLTLQIAIDLLDCKPEDEIISSPMSCLATNQPILTNKLKIVWADIDPKTGTLDPEDVKKRIGPKTKAILHYHWCGYPGYINEINAIAKEKGIYVIEDASESFGAEYHGNKIGNNGSDMVCYSFGPVRLPTTIEGGAISFNSEKLYRKALLMRDYGIERSNFRDASGEITPECDIPKKGYGAMMNEINGFIGLKQMQQFEQLNLKRQANAIAYDSILKESKNISPISKIKGSKPSNWVHTILCEDRDEVMSEFKEKGISASKVHLRNDYYSCFNERFRDDLKGVNEFSKKELCIPSGWWLDSADTENISKALQQLLYENSKS